MYESIDFCKDAKQSEQSYPILSKLAENSVRSLQDTMRTTQIAKYALRLTYSQPANREKMMSRSAVLLAAIGFGLSSFSVRQMVINQTRRI